jgi:hypothetical protein
LDHPDPLLLIDGKPLIDILLRNLPREANDSDGLYNLFELYGTGSLILVSVLQFGHRIPQHDRRSETGLYLSCNIALQNYQ